MPEGDTIHRTADRINAAFRGRRIGVAEAPNPRSPIHLRARELRERTFEQAEARGKHLLLHFSGEVVVHSHLGINGRWRIDADGRAPSGASWLVLASGPSIASQSRGKLLRIVSERKARNDPVLRRLGPDPLGPNFDAGAAVRRLLDSGSGREVGEALLDQRILAGAGNVIRNEACFAAAISPWRQVGALRPQEAQRLIAETERIMRVSVAEGRRPQAIHRPASRRCPRCGGPISSRGQGDDNRTAHWCARCQA